MQLTSPDCYPTISPQASLGPDRQAMGPQPLVLDPRLTRGVGSTNRVMWPSQGLPRAYPGQITCVNTAHCQSTTVHKPTRHSENHHVKQLTSRGEAQPQLNHTARERQHLGRVLTLATLQATPLLRKNFGGPRILDMGFQNLKRVNNFFRTDHSVRKLSKARDYAPSLPPSLHRSCSGAPPPSSSP